MTRTAYQQYPLIKICHPSQNPNTEDRKRQGKDEDNIKYKTMKDKDKTDKWVCIASAIQTGI